MNKEKRNFLVFMGVVVVVVTMIIGIGLYVQHRNDLYHERLFLARRQHIFCEILKPGMDKQTVIRMLEQFGTFNYGKSELSSEESNFDIHGNYDDPQIVGQAYFFMRFRDGKYVDTRLQKGLDIEPVCKPPAAFESSG